MNKLPIRWFRLSDKYWVHIVQVGRIAAWIAAINTAGRFSPRLLQPCLILRATNDLFFAVGLQKCKVSAKRERGEGDKRAAKDIAGDRWGMRFCCDEARTHAPTHPHTHQGQLFVHCTNACETQTRRARRRILTSSLRLANWNSPASWSNNSQEGSENYLFFLFKWTNLVMQTHKMNESISVCKSGSCSPLRILH